MRARRRTTLASVTVVSVLAASGCGAGDTAPEVNGPSAVDSPSTPISSSHAAPAPAPAPAPSTAAETYAVSPSQSWSYSTGGLSAWSEVQTARPEQVAVVADPVRPGYAYSGRFTAGPEDHTFGVTTTIRGEVRASIRETGQPAEGDVQWYSWSTYFPEDFEWDGEDQFLIYTQWHQTENAGSPNVDLWVTDGDDPHMRLTTHGGQLGEDGEPQHTAVYDLGPLTKGVWLDHTVQITWSTDPAAGGVQVWIGDERRVNAVAATLYEGQSAYLKQGIYAADNTEEEHTLYFSDAKRGPTRESVALNAAG